MSTNGPQVGLIMGSDSDWPTMEAAAEALRNAQFITKRIEKTLQLNASYTAMPTAMSLLKRTTARITAETYDDTQVIFSLAIPADDIPAFFSLFDDLDGCSVQ